MFCDVADCSSSCCTALRATQGPKNKGRWSLFFFDRKGRWFWFCVLSAEYSRQQGHLERPALYTTNKRCCCCVTTARPAASLFSNSLFCPLPTVTQFKTLLLRSFQKKKYFLNALAVLLPYLKKRSFQKIKTLLLSNSNSASQCTDN